MGEITSLRVPIDKTLQVHEHMDLNVLENFLSERYFSSDFPEHGEHEEILYGLQTNFSRI